MITLNDTPTNRPNFVRPILFVLPLVLLLGALVLFSGLGRSQQPGAFAAPGGPAVDPTGRATPARAHWPKLADAAALEAQAAAVPVEKRINVGINPKTDKPWGWRADGIGDNAVAPLFELDGNKLVAFSVTNAPRFLTPAEFYDQNFDPETLVNPANRANLVSGNPRP